MTNLAKIERVAPILVDRRSVLLLPLLVLCGSLLATYVLWRQADAEVWKTAQTEFSFQATEAAQLVSQRMQHHDQVLHSVRGLFIGSTDVARGEFAAFFRSLNIQQNYPGIEAIAYIPLVKSDAKVEHIAAMRKQGIADYDITPSGARDLYAPVTYIEPASGNNARALGYDIWSEPSRREALERARDTDSATITDKIVLVQDRGQTSRPGFLMILPLYRQGAIVNTVEARRANLVGWVDTVFRTENLMAGVLGRKSDKVDIEIYDGAQISQDRLLFDNDGIYRGAGSSARFKETHPLQVGGRTWTLLISSLPAFEQKMDQEPEAGLIAVFGTLLSGILALMIWVLTRSRVESIQVAQTLRQELHARKRAEESLQTAALVYDNSSEGMLVTDENNHIVAVNPAFTRITGYTLEDVQGKDPACMASGRHGPEFYRAMWRQLDASGHWQGEIWDRRKNGEIHAKYLTINTSYHEDGSVFRRVALFIDLSEKKQTEEFIWRQANFDALTDLPNRSMFVDRLSQEIKLAHRNHAQFALLFIDLDLFKEVNDTLGHHRGDELLVEAARRLRTCVREVDTVARLGGDEFTIILSETHDAQAVERVVTHILGQLLEPFSLGESVVHVSASVGITLYPSDADDAQGLLMHADQAMYVAKSNGRNCYSYFTPQLQEEALSRQRLISELREAVACKQFILHYQPIVELATGNVCKAEALVRWEHPERGLIGPNTFIPVAEEIGLIGEIGDWVFHQAVDQAKHLRMGRQPDFQISVNKSPKQFRHSSVTQAHWLAYLESQGLPGNCIALEITEGLLLNAVSDVTNKLDIYRKAGVAIAIDDFGTGYSSLGYLKRFDIDYVKIDRAFVRDIETDANDLALSQAIIAMAHALGLKVIAEGVETERQLQLLLEAGCDYAQGFYFAKPMPAAELDALLQAQQAQQWRQRSYSELT